MPTLKKRINISVSKELDRTLVHLAKRDQESVATKVVRLVEEALELDEDIHLAAIADARTKGKVQWISHADVWKHLTK